MDYIKLLWVGDASVSTGFSTITHGVLDNLPQGDYDINVLGVNYHGDPHGYNYNIWPARLGGDILGFNRLEPLIELLKPQIIVLFNDLWVVKDYLKKIKEKFTGKLVTYFPVDSRGYDPDWIKELYRFDKVCVYTNFARDVIRETGYRGELVIIPHGIDTSTYFPIPQNVARSQLAGLTPDDFIVLNVN